MAKEYVIDVYFVDDDDDMYVNYFRKRFQLDLPHNLHTYNSGKTFIRHFVQDCKKRKNQKIVILDYLLKTGDEPDAKTGMELMPMIKHHDSDAEVIILSGRVNYNIKPTAGNYTPVAFVKKDDNAFDHISATIKRLAAKYELDKRQRQTRFSIRIFLLALLAAVFTFVIMYFVRNG